MFWGATDYYGINFEADEERISILNAVLTIGDRRPLLFFIWINRDRENVMRIVFENIDKLPSSMQKMLVAIEEIQHLVPDYMPELNPTARHLFEKEGTEEIERQRNLTNTFLGKLCEGRSGHEIKELGSAEKTASNAVTEPTPQALVDFAGVIGEVSTLKQ